MPTAVLQPMSLSAAGTPPKSIEEFIGRARSGHDAISIARMISPQGWSEPGQCPEFSEYTLVLRGCLLVETRSERYRITAVQAIATEPGEWVRYSTPEPDGAEYVAICLPAFSPISVHRDKDGGHPGDGSQPSNNAGRRASPGPDNAASTSAQTMGR